jgi:hypothetical protein
MKHKFNFILVGLIISAFILSLACQKQKTGWQGTIEEENGIKVVKNPAEPMFGELVFELEEDLSIGSVEDENTMFYRIGGIDVDSQHNIYVLDSGNHRIQKFGLLTSSWTSRAISMLWNSGNCINSIRKEIT